MTKFKRFSVPTLDALAVAIAVYRAQGNRVIRTDGKKPGNKELIKDHFVNELPIPDLHSEATAICESLSQRAMMNTLLGTKNNDFLVAVNSLLAIDTVSTANFGSIAWAPKLFDDAVKSDDARERMLTFAHQSQYVGAVGKKITINFQLIQCRYISSWNSFVHTGHDGQGNLVTFFHKDKIEGGFPISARVKSHKKDEKLSNAFVTTVNYVKVL